LSFEKYIILVNSKEAPDESPIMTELLKDIAIFNWMFGLFLMLLSNASGVIDRDKMKRKGWRKYKMGYSVREIRLYISMIDDPKVINKLKRKIKYRRLYPIFMLSTFILIAIANR